MGADLEDVGDSILVRGRWGGRCVGGGWGCRVAEEDSGVEAVGLVFVFCRSVGLVLGLWGG